MFQKLATPGILIYNIIRYKNYESRFYNARQYHRQTGGADNGHEHHAGVDTALAINIMKTLEDTRGRLKKQIDKYYGDDAAKTGDQKEDGEGEGAQNKNDAPEAAAEAAEE